MSEFNWHQVSQHYFLVRRGEIELERRARRWLNGTPFIELTN
jgi:hypothetical protein